MDPKLAILFFLVSGIVVLSRLSEEKGQRMRREFALRRWRQFVPGRRKS